MRIVVFHARPRSTRRDIADGADQMLVHRVMVVHVELHQAHGMAEFRNEAAQARRPRSSGATRVPDRGARSGFEKGAVGGRIVAHRVGDQIQRARHGAQRMGMDVDAAWCRRSWNMRRIVGGSLCGRWRDWRSAGHSRHRNRRRGCAGCRKPGRMRAQRRARLLVLFFQRGAEDAGQVAHILGHQEVGAHEGFRPRGAAFPDR